MEITLTAIVIVPIGVFLGIIFGGLPGFAASTAVALVMPFSFGLATFEGLTFLLSLYIGALYGGSIPAILLSMPGAPGAAALLLDGQPMAKKGKPVQALAITTFCSVIGSIISVLAFYLIAPVLSRVALQFGPGEMFWVAMWGLTAVIAVKRGYMLKGLFGGLIGLIFGTIGADPLMAQQRFSFGIMELYEGVPFIPALVGLFVFSEMILNVHKALLGEQEKVELKFSEIYSGFKIVISKFMQVIRGGVIGTITGILPGAGASIAAFLSYNVARTMSKNPEEFGEGSSEGIIAPSSADNATFGGALVPLMTLGIPGSAATAVLLGFMMYHGLRPGPRLFMEQWPMISNLVIMMILGSLSLGIIGIIMIRFSSMLTQVDYRVLAPSVLILTALATISASGNPNDIIIMIGFGLIGIVFKIYNFSVISVVLGIILGPIAERNLLMSLRMTDNIVTFWLSRPIAIGLIILCIFSILYPMYSMRVKEGLE